MKLFGLIGFPLTHSFSKRYFDEKFVKENLADCSFENFEIASVEQINTIIRQNPALQGFAVTIPHKQNILPFLNNSTEEVKQMNACNCVIINQGQLLGFNTDVIGFEKSFTPLLQKHHNKALVLGTGGAAQAVFFVLNKLNIPFTVVSRKADAEKGFISYQQADKFVLQQHTVIINTTPLGTYPNVEDCPDIPYNSLTPQHYLFDLVYNPAKTKFLLKGEQQGATIKNGYDMLTIQAEENWRIWNAM